jgi:hypothetical protein
MSDACEKSSAMSSASLPVIPPPAPKNVTKLYIIDKSKNGVNIETAVESFPLDNALRVIII